MQIVVVNTPDALGIGEIVLLEKVPRDGHGVAARNGILGIPSEALTRSVYQYPFSIKQRCVHD